MDYNIQDYHFYKTYKKMRLWRFLAFTIALIAIILLALAFTTKSSIKLLNNPYIARVNIEGVIMDEADYAKKISDLKDDSNVKAVIIGVNSPGGTTIDSEILYKALRNVASKKPVVTQMTSVAASGGYIVSMAGDYIFANGNTITGSIGVIMQVPEFSGLMKNLGIGINEIRTSPLKAEPTYYRPIGEKAKENMQDMIYDAQKWFLHLVSTRRIMNESHFDKATNGGVYSGRQALKLGLVDALGDEKDVMKWLSKNHKIAKDLEIIDIYKDTEEEKSFFASLFGQIIENILGIKLKNVTPNVFAVDGMISLWQS